VITTLVLSRHGRTVWHAENRYAGSSDIDLDATGVAQAGQLADWAVAHRPDALYVSPLRRARETMAPVEAAVGLTATVRDDLRELHFGIAEGFTMAEMAVSHPEPTAAYLANPAAAMFAGGEPIEAAAARGSRALLDVAAAHGGGTVLVVAHNALLRVVLCALLGIPLGTYRQVLPGLSNGTLTTLRITDGRAGLLSFNVPL
jgi:2,3-bisphosphoglycerate-dependent phosphoglycerate mutase